MEFTISAQLNQEQAQAVCDSLANAGLYPSMFDPKLCFRPILQKAADAIPKNTDYGIDEEPSGIPHRTKDERLVAEISEMWDKHRAESGVIRAACIRRDDYEDRALQLEGDLRRVDARRPV